MADQKDGAANNGTPVGYPPEKLEFFSAKLQEQRREILQGIMHQKAEIDGFQGEAEADAYDDASNLVEMNILMALSDTQQAELTQITAALAKIQDGSYGICEGCSELIGEPRLKALPFASLCVNCKSKQEQGTVIINRESRLSSADDVIYSTDDDHDF